MPMNDSNGPTWSQPVISSGGAKTVLGAAEAKAAEIGVPVIVAVVDSNGDLKALIGMDGAPKGAIQWSIDKASQRHPSALARMCSLGPWAPMWRMQRHLCNEVG